MQPEDYATKLTEIFDLAACTLEKLGHIKMNKSRLNFIRLAVSAMAVSRSVQFCELSDKMDTKSLEASNLRRTQRFMSEYTLDYDWIMGFLLLLLPRKAKVRLSIDRTEWEFGSQNHNVLVVTLYTHGIGIPIWFECLDNEGGNSSTDDRMYVMMCCIDMLGKKRIKSISGDCEFIGQEWIRYLIEAEITFFLDVRTNQYFEYNGIRHQISVYMAKRHKAVLNGVEIFGHTLGIAMKRHAKQWSSKGKKATMSTRKPFLAIVTNANATNALAIYKGRWSIEVLFLKLKTHGFNLEDTHIKDPVRLRKLFALCAIAFMLCLVVGLAINKDKPIPLKNHGYKAKGFFRYGLDFIRKVAKKGRLRSDIMEINTLTINLFEEFIATILRNFTYLQKNVM